MRPYRGQGLNQPLPIADYNSFRALVANTVESVTVPAGAKFALIAATTLVTVKKNADPPNVADLDDGTGGMLVNPNYPLIVELDPDSATLRFNAPAVCNVGVSFYGQA